MCERGSSAPERVAETLRAELLDGLHPPGTRLKEQTLSDRFHVGRYTVRTALRGLVSSGLLAHEPNRGAVIPELTRERIEEVCSFRAVVELGSLRLALAEGAGLEPVETAVAELEALDDDAPWHLATAVHRAIHHAIVAAPANPRLLNAYSLCEDELQYILAFIHPEISVPELAAQHRRLVDQLRAGGETAVQALHQDLELSGRANLIAALHRMDDKHPDPKNPDPEHTDPEFANQRTADDPDLGAARTCGGRAEE